VARLEISVVEDETFETEIGVMYPDVELIKVRSAPAPAGGAAVAGVVATAAPLTITIPQVRLVTIEIRDTAQNQLVTSIKIISPVNKREPNLSRYRQKRERIRQAEVHLLEIDLLRRGSRVWEYRRLPETPYMVVLIRAASLRIIARQGRAETPYMVVLIRAASSTMEIWPIALQEALPVLPVPLRPPDKDVALDLSAALSAVYDEAYYHLSIDYQQEPPPPTLSPEDQAWLREMLRTVTGI
jgi:hypothetical protein